MDTKQLSDKLLTKLRELSDKPDGWGDIRTIEPVDARSILAALDSSDAAPQLAVNADDLDFTPDEKHSIYDMANIGKALLDQIAVALPGYCWNESPVEIVCDLINQRDDARADYDRIREALAQWAVERWNAEVRNRPLFNVHRRGLDDTWRQVIRHCGADDVALIGKTHDDLVAEDAR